METIKNGESRVASREVKTAAERRRIPMSVPVQKLDAPEIPGYHLHWFRGEPDRIQRALDAGYEYVTRKEMRLTATGLGSDSTISGTTDLGGNVSVVAGGTNDQGQPNQLILMKQKLEYYEEDQALVAARNGSVAQALTSGSIGAEKEVGSNAQMRYVGNSRVKIPDMFNPNKPPRTGR